MHLALISDVHGNAAALQAVLDDARASYIDSYLFVGDYIFDLPFSVEVMRLMERVDRAMVIQGNKEARLPQLAARPKLPLAEYPRQSAAMECILRSLTPEALSGLTAMPEEVRLSLGHGFELLARHSAPELYGRVGKTDCPSAVYRQRMVAQPFDHDNFLASMQEFMHSERAKDSLASYDADIIVIGHTHLQWHATCAGKLIINPGSCGQPLDFDSRAAYSILHVEQERIWVEECRVVYDMEAVVKSVRSSEAYRQGSIYTELVCQALRSGQDVFAPFFGRAEEIAAVKGETGQPFSDETWQETADYFERQGGLLLEV